MISIHAGWLACIAALALTACDDAPVMGPAPSAEPLAHAAPRADEYELIDLGTFGGGTTLGLELDKHGTVYGRYMGPDGSQRSFRWTEKGGYEDLGGIDGLPFQLLNVNDHGLLSGFVPVQSPPAFRRAVAYVPREGFVYLDPGEQGISGGSNEKGAVAGTRFRVGEPSQAFLWTRADGVFVLPLEIRGVTTRITAAAADVNEKGVVTGTLSYRASATEPVERRAFLWDAANGTRLVPPLSSGSVGVTFVSDEGIVVGASETRAPLPGERSTNPLSSTEGDVPVHAWKWSESLGLVDLGTLGGTRSVPWHVDEEGNVYGWATDAAGVRRAVKWTAAGSVVVLGTLGGDSQIGAVNKHGVVTGWSVAPGGETHAVLFVPRKR